MNIHEVALSGHSNIVVERLVHAVVAMSLSAPPAPKRFDLHQTSTGRGHDWRPAYYFPASDFKQTIHNPLPPQLAKQDEIIKPFSTTTGDVHDYKMGGGVYSNDLHKKAPGNWKVHYTKDTHEKLQGRQWRRPLTTGSMETEMQANYKGLPSKINFDNFVPGTNPLPPLLENHHANGPMKSVVPSTENQELRGRPFYARDPAILTELDPYISTTHKDHRPYAKRELSGYPKKDAATYWRCEDYPQAWGHGTKHNPLPPGSVPRERLPMRDDIWFKTRIKEPVRWPEKFKRVPHSGMRTEKQAKYIEPSDLRMKQNYLCPVDTPWVLPEPGPKEIFSVPRMYKTEYMTYASGETVKV
ncbi:stabilizer of axonemal microtubules 3-like [Saccoglossus kowalevskii]